MISHTVAALLLAAGTLKVGRSLKPSVVGYEQLTYVNNELTTLLLRKKNDFLVYLIFFKSTTPAETSRTAHNAAEFNHPHFTENKNAQKDLKLEDL